MATSRILQSRIVALTLARPSLRHAVPTLSNVFVSRDFTSTTNNRRTFTSYQRSLARSNNFMLSTSTGSHKASFTTEGPATPSSNHPHTPLPNAKGALLYTETDEAPALATFSLLPVLTKLGKLGDVDVIPVDISVAGRILSSFPDFLKPAQQVPDNLAWLGEICKTPTANVVKLPNVSASIPQLEECIAELRAKGYDVPLYPAEPSTPEEEEIAARYSKVLGSAVNPVLREGNSDRRVAPPVKDYAQKNPHRMMKMWSKASRTHVAHMAKGDFFETEQSVTIGDKPTEVCIEFVASDGSVKVMKESVSLEAGEVFDSSMMSVAELEKFYEQEMQMAKDADLMMSLHMKATMMKISDPIIFGHCVRVFFKSAFDKHASLFEEIGANPNNGLGAIYDAVAAKLPENLATAVKADLDACYNERPWLAMVDSDKGITNLHVPSDIIIDASMPNVIRDGGMMWNKDDELEDVVCLIPDRSYATTYQEVISFVKSNGQFDPATMGSVANVGLMAQKAEEYGSHDKTFEIPEAGTMRIRDLNSDEVYMSHEVSKGDIWRACQTKDAPIKDWVRLAVSRARATGAKTMFWLDENRAHDAQIIAKVNEYIKEHDTSGLDISIKKPADACRISMKRAVKGEDTISVTGNVLRDYLTDLFPILELGTSAKMLSIVPLLAGGGLFETGAGGSAPKHVQQFVKEGHLRWDSLGEYLATAVAFTELEKTDGNPKAKMLGDCLNEAVGRLLRNRKAPSRRVKEIDNRAVNFYVALYWAEALAEKDPETYKPVADKIAAARSQIVEELSACQGKPMDVGGYFMYDYEKANKAMNPSPTLNAILEEI